MRILLAGAAVALIGAASPDDSPGMPLAKASAGQVAHKAERLSVRLPKQAIYLGSERFTLYGVADAEVHVFAEVDTRKRMRRLYWVQFESYLPSRTDARYDYGESDRRMSLSGVTTWVRSNPVPTTGPGRPGSDREHVMAILNRAGVAIPPEVMNVRMVQLLDDPKGTGYGRRELMVIYSEDLALSGKNLAELRTDGKLNASWAPIEEALIGRALKAVRITRK